MIGPPANPDTVLGLSGRVLVLRSLGLVAGRAPQRDFRGRRSRAVGLNPGEIEDTALGLSWSYCN